MPGLRQKLWRETDPGEYAINEVAFINDYMEAFRMFYPGGDPPAPVMNAERTRGAALATVLNGLHYQRRELGK